MMGTNDPSLSALWNEVIEINELNCSENDLMPIFGGGQSFRPKFMFIFINSTFRGISSNKKWNGPRFPFVGTNNMWGFFSKSGLLDSYLLDEIYGSKKWSYDLANRVLSFLVDKSFYFTNIVKYSGKNNSMSNAEKIKLFMPILKKEISIVRPEYIITFGLIPFENLTGEKIKLSDYYDNIIKNKAVSYTDVYINNFRTKVIPCYFPVGHENHNRAINILSFLNTL